MTNYTSTFVFYNSFKEQLGESVNLQSDTFKMLLVTNSYTPNASTHSVLSDITNEVSGNGYARQTLAGVSFSEAGGTAAFDFDDVVFEASGGSWTARRYVIFDDSVASPLKPLVGYGLLRSDDQDITITDGNTLTFQTPSGGLFTLA